MIKGSFEELVTLVQGKDYCEAGEWLQELASGMGFVLDRESQDEMIMLADEAYYSELQRVWDVICSYKSSSYQQPLEIK